MSAISIRFVAACVMKGRPQATFFPESLASGATVSVRGHSPGGWVFCSFGSGGFLVVKGGSAELMSS